MKWLKRKIRNIGRYVAYAMSSICIYLSGRRKLSKKTICGLKDKHFGKRCFIIGNGPSLTVEDLNLLKGEITFASNKIFKLFDKTDWRPSYYAIFDESVVTPQLIEEINKLVCEGKFFREQGFYKYKRIKESCYIHSWYSRKYLDAPDFSVDISKGVYSIATVTYVLIQIARYMGFKEIYLLGMDNKYAYSKLRDGSIVRNEGVVSYFKEMGESVPSSQIAVATWEMDVAYQHAEEYSRSNGFRIYNATRGGFLETFERVDIEKIISKGDF